MSFPLTIIAGAEARKRLRAEGWQPELFTAIVGASGGAKLLGIAHLDQIIFNDFLSRSDHSMELYGSSIGSWRHAALASGNPDAIATLQDRYLKQSWDRNDPRSTREIVDSLCEWVLDGFLDEGAIRDILGNPRFNTHIVTARGLGLNSRTADWLLGIGMGASALGNLFSRKLLGLGFQRVIFSTGPACAFHFDDFNSLHIPLTTDLLKPVLKASGSIPFLMSGVSLSSGAPTGQYWDGGVIDYHFDFANQSGEGLVLYPHFGTAVIKGWFDKKLPWRRNSTALLERTVVIAPSEHYLAELPEGRIPDRKDFSRYTDEQRLANWQTCIDRSRLLAGAFDEVISNPDPLAYLD